MISFETDYIEGCHEKILDAFRETNYVQVSGYGSDPFTKSAIEKMRIAMDNKDADIYLLGGGTQTNQIVIDTMLQPYEGVISCVSGHVSVHEAGAIEFSGHKVLALAEHDGKLDADEVDTYVKTFYQDGNHEHMVFPKMVYISYPTELGTIYSKEELQKLHDVCKQHDLIFFIDGARLGYGLMSKQADVTLQDIAKLADVFYIGGTKIGALCGEAVVFTKNNTPSHFVTRIKQHGALFAKGRLNGIQFDTLFTDNLYFDIAKNAIDRAEDIKAIFHKYGYTFFLESPTNQQFIILENTEMEALSQKIKFSFWDKYDDTHTVVRFVTSWATTKESVEILDKELESFQKEC